jgi:hypothetical protein
LSSFDHNQFYGLPTPIDAKEQLIRVLGGKICNGVELEQYTADLTLHFDMQTKLQIFNFTG